MKRFGGEQSMTTFCILGSLDSHCLGLWGGFSVQGKNMLLEVEVEKSQKPCIHTQNDHKIRKKACHSVRSSST
jgi:hypothetical protein